MRRSPLSKKKENLILLENKLILTGKEIAKKLGTDINIKPYEETLLNPNSYNLRLHNELLVYTNMPLDMKKPNPSEKIIIPEEGYLLKPGIL